MYMLYDVSIHINTIIIVLLHILYDVLHTCTMGYSGPCMALYVLVEALRGPCEGVLECIKMD